MNKSVLEVSIGQATDRGVKAVNQDFHAAHVPDCHLLKSKGVVVALADGISSSNVSHEASATSVQSFINDYFSTSEAWSVKTSGLRVLEATNSWLHVQARRNLRSYDPNLGYVCTFNALVIKSRTIHIFHVGDSRVYHLHPKHIHADSNQFDQDHSDGLELLTADHRFYTSEEHSYLTRALGMDTQLEVDYHAQTIDTGDIFINATDGIYEFVSEDFIVETIERYRHDLNFAAQTILKQAQDNDSDDNLTIQIIRIDKVQDQTTEDVHQQVTELPFPPNLKAREEFDGYRILRPLHTSPRSHVYLAQDIESGTQVILKTPSGELRDNTAYLERFLLEDWVARRIDNPHVVRPGPSNRPKNYLYLTTEYIQGQTLDQWMRDHPEPDLETVRNILEQAARGVQAFHRLEMLHQDLKPDNLMMEPDGTVRVLDFGSTRVAGIIEIESPLERQNLLGTAQYSAPEYFLGGLGSTESDVYALGVITYEMLTGKLPYGSDVARIRKAKDLNKLHYVPVRQHGRVIPIWVDEAIRKAVHPQRSKRYSEPSEFIYDLRNPNADYLRKSRAPVAERNPVVFWQGVSSALFIVVLYLLYQQTR
jgi:serine/threonine protein phosphatase PrpC